MALTSTMYNFNIELSDADRGVYETLKCAAARHPSETEEFLATRLLAFCLEYEEGLSFSKGLSDGEEPAIWSKFPDGRIKDWIEVGVPTPSRLHKASKLAERVAVYTHKPPAALIQQLSREKIHRAEHLPIYSFDQAFLRQLAGLIERRTSVSISVSDRQVYVEIHGTNVFTSIERQTAA